STAPTTTYWPTIGWPVAAPGSKPCNGQVSVGGRGVARYRQPFPTRRSSDLCQAAVSRLKGAYAIAVLSRREPDTILAARRGSTRSEEHTSGLQSRENLVCRLLLEKKNGDRPARAHEAEDWRGDLAVGHIIAH